MRTQTGKAYLFVGIDRTSKFVYVEVHASATAHHAAVFLKNLIFAVPYKVHTLLTDNRLQFSLRLMKRQRNYQSHPFEDSCKEFGLEHRLTQFYHPLNRTLKEATVKKYY